MTERLDKCIAEAKTAPPEVQDRIAEAMEEALADAKWDELLASERSQRWLREQAAEVRRLKAEGKLLPMPCDHGAEKE